MILQLKVKLMQNYFFRNQLYIILSLLYFSSYFYYLILFSSVVSFISFLRRISPSLFFHSFFLHFCLVFFSTFLHLLPSIFSPFPFSLISSLILFYLSPSTPLRPVFPSVYFFSFRFLLILPSPPLIRLQNHCDRKERQLRRVKFFQLRPDYKCERCVTTNGKYEKSSDILFLENPNFVTSPRDTTRNVVTQTRADWALALAA